MDFNISLNCISVFGIIRAVEVIIKTSKYSFLKHYLEIHRVGFYDFANGKTTFIGEKTFL